MNAKQESEKLMNALLPFAEKMLARYGEFYPYGGYTKPDGDIVDIGFEDPDSDHPKSHPAISVLRELLKEKARRHQCTAVALVFDVRVTEPGSTEPGDAIQVCVDHIEGYSAEVFFPYRLVGSEVRHGTPFAQKGSAAIFEAHARCSQPPA